LWYFFLTTTYHFPLPVQFTAGNTPCIEVIIENKKYPMVVDLGSKFQMSMRPNVLKKIYKRSSGTASWINIKGKRHQYPQYIISNIEIGSLMFKEITTVEKPFKASYVLWSDPDESKLEKFIEPAGYLGKSLLEKMNLLFDLAQARMIVTNSLKKLQKEGYDIKNFVKVPLEITDKSVLIQVKTEFGFVKLGLDTGATRSCLRASLLEEKTSETTYHGIATTTLNKVVIGGHDFGKLEPYILDIANEITSTGIDGVLGMDFFREHIIYLDFSKKTAYIK